MMNADMTRKSVGTIGSAVSNSWFIVGIGDINSDGIGDLIWWNYETGHVAYWLLNPDGSRAAAGSIGTEPDTSFQLLEVGR